MAIKHHTIQPPGTIGAIDEPQWAEGHDVDSGGITFFDSTVQTTAAKVAGSSKQIQFNSTGAFSASAKLTWDDVSEILLLGSGSAIVTVTGPTGTAGLQFSFAATSGVGSPLSFICGSSTGGNGGGALLFRTGGDTGGGNGGNLTIQCGSGTGLGGGGFSAQAGADNNGGNGGVLSFAAGNSSLSGTGGSVLFSAGINGATPANGGLIQFFGGQGALSLQVDALGNTQTATGFGDSSHQVTTPAGANPVITLPNNVWINIMIPAASPPTTMSITMPSAPAEGQLVSVTCTKSCASVTFHPNAGQSIVGAPTSFTANAPVGFIFDVTNATWYRYH